MRGKIIAVDFDGTLIEEGKWPGVGEANEEVLNYLKDQQKNGAKIVLWTNRSGDSLATAVRWCHEQGLKLDAVNDNLPESIAFYGENIRKIYADEFIDDRALTRFKLPYVVKNEPDIVPLAQVLCDMSDPEGGIKQMAAEEYYYEHYATDQEKKRRERVTFIANIISVIFVIFLLGIIYLGTSS